MRKMNSRERVLCAINRQPVDRPACDFWAEEAAKTRLYNYIRHKDLNRFLDDMDVDIRGVECGVPQERLIGNGVFQNYWGERYGYRETPWGDIREDTKGALFDAQEITDILEFAWPKNDDIDYSTLLDQCYKNEGRAIRYGNADIWERPALVRGLENTFIDMAVNPKVMHTLSRVFTDFYKEDYMRAQEKSNGKIDIYTVYSDLGGQDAPLISLSMFHDFVEPYLRELVDFIHELGAKVLYHSCGMIEPFIESLIDIGIDILDPIQPTTKAMQPEVLGRKYGGQLCFHGGIDVQDLLINGSPEDVHNTVERYVQTLCPGYIVGPAHYFQPEIPPENIIALYETLNSK